MPNLDLPDVILNHRKLGARIILATSSYDVPVTKRSRNRYMHLDGL
ncbi:hypothetical protein MGH68_06060 [Erysipelothrix sp. D19-032]